jgi:uncharacterized 2Fe-2S/4Fe-4S cluster protein (DUF4445 family)
MPHRPPAASAGSARSHALRFPELDRLIVAHPGETIFQCARRSALRIIGACGGRGACGACAVRIAEGVVEHVDGRPLQPRATRSSERARWVRSCQVLPRSDCTVEVEQRALAPIVRAEADAGQSGEALPFDPMVIGFDIAVAPPTLRDPQSDADRVIRASPVPITAIDLAAARELPGLLRASNWSARMLLREGEAIAFAPANRPTLGLAVDLGTTNVAGFLIDLSSGVRVASLGIENPQVAWGADVISRINHAIRDAAAADELRAAAVAAINALAHDLCHAVGSRATDILDVTVCGNTAMHHLLLGLPVRQLGRAPFVAALREAIDVKARDLGVAIAPGGYLHAAPNVGGFVGGDHVAALLATEPLWANAAAALVMDIGTNTEMSLIHGGEIVTASCPSGPALEGGHISCGMRAAEGAIERVAIAPDGIAIGVIGDKKPVGVCGSGVLDTVAALRGAGLLDGGGRLVARHPAIRELKGRRAVALTPDVHFTQADIRAVQLAKAAIRTSIELLLRIAGLDESAIERVVIAGAFGSYIDVRSALAVGLLPALPPECISQVGNAAGLGVRQMLTSRKARARARELAGRCRYVELSTRADFQKSFMHNIGFRKPSEARRAS